ncbi:MAG: DUF1638 domain-containing protein [Clostridia bacterium]|jgi:hypothetical protein|nr:DUF1638 domain-containing protein [Clostridia bacterium]
MTYAVIACQALRYELEKEICETGCAYPVIWVGSEYHIDPNKLRVKLQGIIDSLKNIDNILLVYGSCGNGLVGLTASTANLIIPKTDDCISLLLTKSNEKVERAKGTYFLTKGWIESPKSIINEYVYTLKRYGEEKTKKIYNLMLKHYRYLMLIDTGAYNIEECKSEAAGFAANQNLELIIAKGDTWFLRKLLLGPYDKDFCIIKKGENVNLNHFGIG